MSIATYSPEDVVILLGGIVPLEGLSEGSFISISKDTPQYNTVSTADGRVSRINVEDPTHIVTITLTSYSNANLIFSAWTAADELVQSAMIPLFVKDGLGSTLFYAPLCWVEKVPDTSFDVSTTDRVWTLRTAGGKLVNGGNMEGALIDSNLAALGFIAADVGNIL